MDYGLDDVVRYHVLIPTIIFSYTCEITDRVTAAGEFGLFNAGNFTSNHPWAQTERCAERA